MLDNIEQYNEPHYDMNQIVINFFTIEEAVKADIQQSVDSFTNQAELDEVIHLLAQQKYPGLKGEISCAIRNNDTEEVMRLHEIANRQAMIAIRLRFCRKAVTRIIRNNYKEFN